LVLCLQLTYLDPLNLNTEAMKERNGYFLFLVIWILLVSCKQEDRPQAIIDHFKTVHAPDKRVALFDIRWEDGQLQGETNLPEALDQLSDSLNASSIAYKNEVAVLPHESLAGKHYGVVTLSVANLRSQPKHSAELSTQATLGTPVRVLKENDGWYLIQTPDEYLSWVDAAGIALMDEQNMDNWYASKKVVFTSLTGHVYEDKYEEGLVSDLTAGNILELVQEGPDYHQVKLPDGRSGLVEANSVSPYQEWIATRSTSAANLVATAKSMMGSPYLWGGTSIKGTDCSGFTKTIFFLNGQIIPRDASQQILEGQEVDTDQNWDNLQVGDLLFFGVPATAGSRERVVHVGMWIGDNSFIHSRGRVRISSFDPNSEHYDEYELNRYLRTKRIVGEESRNVLAVNEIIKG
jgi:cell wall-associated NlpC family hydrolase